MYLPRENTTLAQPTRHAPLESLSSWCLYTFHCCLDPLKVASSLHIQLQCPRSISTAYDPSSCRAQVVDSLRRLFPSSLVSASHRLLQLGEQLPEPSGREEDGRLGRAASIFEAHGCLSQETQRDSPQWLSPECTRPRWLGRHRHLSSVS